MNNFFLQRSRLYQLQTAYKFANFLFLADIKLLETHHIQVTNLCYIPHPLHIFDKSVVDMTL